MSAQHTFAHPASDLQVVEWLVEMPHPSTLAGDAEREALAAEAADLLRLTAPAGAAAVSELHSLPTELLGGSLWVSSSAGGSRVVLSHDMDISAAAGALGSLQGVTHIAVERSGSSRTGYEYVLTFQADKYAAGDVPELTVVNNDMTGATPDCAHNQNNQDIAHTCDLALRT